MKLPSGWIFRPIVDRKGINLTLKRTDLVLCKDCKFWERLSNWHGHCKQHGGFEPPENWFCADGEEESE